MAQTSGNFFDQFDPPQSGAPQGDGNFFDQFDPPPQQRTIIAAPPPRETERRSPFSPLVGHGYAGQVRAMAAQGPDKVAPRSFGELGQSYADLTTRYAKSLPGSVIGTAGNVESLGRQGLAAVGVPISPENLLPTSEQFTNKYFGEPRNQDEAFGQTLADITGPGAMFKAAKIAGLPTTLTRPIAGAGPTESALAAHESGYVLPPGMVTKKPGIISQAVSMISGRDKLRQAASVKNQDVTNRLAREAFGLPEDAPLGPQEYKAIRDEAGQHYANVGNAVPQIAQDQTFFDAAGGLGEQMSAGAKEFPELINNAEIQKLTQTLQAKQTFSPQAGLDLVRSLRSKASANLRAFDSPEKQALGLAQRHAAEEVDNLIERKLAAEGHPDLVQAYRDARQRIAQSYDVEAATDPVTGDVSARMLAALADKGRPLSGQIKDIADAARTYRKAMQSPSTFGGEEPLGILDAAAAIGSHGATIPLSLARPGSRSFILSAPYQKMLMSGPRSGPNYATRIGALAAPEEVKRIEGQSQ